MVLCESHQDWFEFVVMYKTRIPHANVMKNFGWEGIQLCAIFVGIYFLVGRMEDLRVGGWCSVSE